MITTTITRGGVAYTLLLDDCDAHLLGRYIRVNKGYAYIRTYVGTVDGKRRDRDTAIHRIILGLAAGDPRDVDHINRNRMDNRRCNLRAVTHAENQQNLGAQPKRARASAFRGVTWNGRKWIAQAKVGGKGHRIGGFDDEAQAASAAAAWRAEHMPYSVEGGGGQ
jgi:hypothetical protein